MTGSLRRRENVQLNPVNFDYATDQPDLNASVRLFPHQKRMFSALTSAVNSTATDLYVLTSMTGSGKTLANVLPAVATGANAIFTYPTKPLVRDQCRSINEDAAQFGFDEDVTVKCIRSADLRRRSQNQGTNIPELLFDLFSTARTEPEARIFLTTPDTLYNIVAGRYWNAEEFSQPMDRGQEALAGAVDYLVFDEFHMYGIESEVSMINLATLLHHTEREELRFPIVFSSATSEDQLEAWLERIARGQLRKFTDAEAISENGAHRIAGSIDLTIQFGPQWDGPNAFWESHDEETLRELSRSGPVTAIFESAKRTINLVKRLKSETALADHVAYATGPRSSELELTADRTKIQVGTRTLSVGIDFDTEYLFFESYRARDFLQKLGRVGRATDEATAIAYTSEYAFDEGGNLQNRYRDRRDFEDDLLSGMYQRRRIRSYAFDFGPSEFDWMRSNFPMTVERSATPPWGVSPVDPTGDLPVDADQYARSFRDPGVPQAGIVVDDSVEFQNIFDVIETHELRIGSVLSEDRFLDLATEIDSVAAQYVRRGTIEPVLFLEGTLPVSITRDVLLRTERETVLESGLVQYSADSPYRLEIESTQLPNKIRRYIDERLSTVRPLLFVMTASEFDSIRGALPHLFRTYELKTAGRSYEVAFGQNALKLWSMDHR